jgi:hypothetical protein
MTRSILALAALLATAALVGCGGPSPSPSPSISVAPQASAAPSADATDASRHADPELEALLPETLGGVALTRESQRGSELSQQSDALGEFLAGLGGTLDGFTLASAYSRSGDLEAQVGAWRIPGADSAQLMPGFIEAIQASSTTKLTITDISLGGHDVTQIGVSGQLTQGPLYAYVKGDPILKTDTILFVQTPDPALALEALSAMP